MTGEKKNIPTNMCGNAVSVATGNGSGDCLLISQTPVSTARLEIASLSLSSFVAF